MDVEPEHNQKRDRDLIADALRQVRDNSSSDADASPDSAPIPVEATIPSDAIEQVATGSDKTVTRVQRRRSPNRKRPTSDSFPGYEIIAELARGGQGVVYHALQERTKQQVAIKVLRAGEQAADVDRRRFEREMELIAQLRHPNIIGVLHSGTTESGELFFVMDFIEGTPLKSFVRDNDLTLRETLDLFLSVCSAVQFAHQRGVIHRDLKPSNILVDEDGTPKILDFGLARRVEDPAHEHLTLTQGVLGTLPYMSPEQSRGEHEQIDTRTDVYALGVILYELLTGQFPYPVVGQVLDVLWHISRTEPTPPRQRWNDESGVLPRSSRWRRSTGCPIDDDVETIVLRALAKEPERRYQSAGEIGRDIQHYLSGEPIEAKRDSFWYVLRKLGRRNVPQVIVATSVIAILVSAATVVAQYALEAQRERAKGLANVQVAAREQTQMRLMEDELRQGALAWFLVEWHADRIETARQCRDRLAAAAPACSEVAVMDFLINDDLGFEDLQQRVSGSDPLLVFFALGERGFKQRQFVEARRAYEQALLKEPSKRWQDLLAGRLRQLESLSPRETPSSREEGVE